MDIDLVSPDLGTQALLLVAAFVLSAVIGIERELRHKGAGARTHILVGVGSALFTLVSVYGFAGAEDVTRDPARIAAQIVTGIGFLGAGVIFVRQNIVSGLTTAASIWVTAAVGMACGAGMPAIAALAVGLYLLTVFVVTFVVQRLRDPRHSRYVTIRYADGHGLLREILSTASQLGYDAALTHTQRLSGRKGAIIQASLRFTPGKDIRNGGLVEALTALPGVYRVSAATEEND
ncbi:MgtC/SapB family protein [Brevibacterium luteolum]|uniref:MgtC/SapB family protein n=1 Tax=Brevibacterium luteolum TaxID=199591 RepID=UPI001C226528|nr:MgtC/SapB family protein [Brevibacterium luteolum]